MPLPFEPAGSDITGEIEAHWRLKYDPIFIVRGCPASISGYMHPDSESE
jgi:hypothetical protein